jgi:hypothetical protein
MNLFDLRTSVYVGLRLRYETICFMYLFDLGTSVYVLLKTQI